MRFLRQRGVTLVELLIGLAALAGIIVIVWSVVKPLIIQSSKVSASSIMSAYQGYLEENLSLLEVWLPMSADLEAGNAPLNSEIKLGTVLLAKHPQNNPTYLDRYGGICPENNDQDCFFKVEFEIKNFGTVAAPMFRFAYRLMSTPSSKVILRTGAPGNGIFLDDDYTGLVPVAAYMNTASSACLGSGLFMKGIDLSSMTPICVSAPSAHCSDSEIPTGYRVVATSPGSQFFEVEWICSPSNKINCPDGYVLESINPRQFLNTATVAKSRCVFGGVSNIVIEADETCPINYDASPFVDAAGLPKISCNGKAPVDATVTP